MVYRVRHLLREDITYSAAQRNETNILKKLTYYASAIQFRKQLIKSRKQITALVLEHTRSGGKAVCHIPHNGEWINGSFNLCIPATIEYDGFPERKQRLMIRFPLPYKVGESFREGNADEKLRSEAATYAWLAEHCPDIPIPRLWSFGDSRGQCLIEVENAPFQTGWLYYLRRTWLFLLGRPTPSRYVRHPRTHTLPAGFMLLEFVEESTGRMLSDTWNERREDDVTRRKNLFRGLSKIIISMSRVPLPRIGSFTIDNEGFVSLTHRPLTADLYELENDHIPLLIPRNRTYESTIAYVTDLLSCHRQRLIYGANAAVDESDCKLQMAALTSMSALLIQQFPSEGIDDSFHLSLTDCHPSNIFVDDDWNITKLIDLEWACTRPLQMLRTPFWLTGPFVDVIDVDKYDMLRGEFLAILAEQEHGQGLINPQVLTGSDCRPSNFLALRMQQNWENGNFWYCLALDSVAALYAIFEDRIQPRFDASHGNHEHFYSIFPQYFVTRASDFIRERLAAKKEYDILLEAEFLASESSTTPVESAI